jgi:hypothetical protein
VHLVRVDPAQPQPRLLHRVLGRRRLAEHPVRHRPQPAALRLEPIRQPVVRHLHGHLFPS